MTYYDKYGFPTFSITAFRVWAENKNIHLGQEMFLFEVYHSGSLPKNREEFFHWLEISDSPQLKQKLWVLEELLKQKVHKEIENEMKKIAQSMCNIKDLFSE